MFATYVHDLSPVLIRFTDQIQLRWYGLAYLGAFLVGAWLLNVLAKRKLWVLPAGAAADFIFAAGIFGVFLGGRLGYILFYYLPSEKHGWHALAEDPLVVFKVWEGGMASHGGILGLVIFTWVYARRKKVSWRGLGDGLCVVSPLGLFFGRMANFINGELYGRVADGVSWAMKFPLALLDVKQPEGKHLTDALEAAAAASPRFNEIYSATPPVGVPAPTDVDLFNMMLPIQRQEPAISKAIEPFLQPRHPSQLYEGALEGLALFAILWFVRLRYPKAPAGVLTGLFFIFYAIFRIVSEQFREPDADKFGFLTRGQFLSLFMIVAGAIFISSHRWVKSKYPATLGTAEDSGAPATSGS